MEFFISDNAGEYGKIGNLAINLEFQWNILPHKHGKKWYS
jgi:hypothetical protein